MQLTRYDRERLGGLLGAAALAGHALPALKWSHGLLSLPMEAGGLFFGPFFGLPLLLAGLLLLVGAGLLVSGHTWPPAVAALASLTVGDTLALLFGSRDGWLLVGWVLAATALASFASLVRIDTRGASRHDIVVTVVAFLLGGFILVLVLPHLA